MTELGEDCKKGKASGGADAGEGGAPAAGDSAVAGAAGGGSSGYHNGGRGDVPMTVFTRHEAAQDTYNPLLYGCRSVNNYQRITFIDEGAYGKVRVERDGGRGGRDGGMINWRFSHGGGSDKNAILAVQFAPRHDPIQAGG